VNTTSSAPSAAPELVCPAGSLPALKAAVDNGANCVYLGLRDATNARNFAGLNFDEAAIASGVQYAHQRGCKVFMALNTYPQASNPGLWREAVDKAVALGVDAVILADPGLMQYAKSAHPQLRLHLSVQGSATNYEAINFYREQFGAAARAVAVAGAAGDRENAGGNRGVRLRQPVRHGRGPLLPVVLCHGRIAQHFRRLFAAQGRALAGNAAGPGVAPERRPDRPLRTG
jgi:hypothetical protein